MALGGVMIAIDLLVGLLIFQLIGSSSVAAPAQGRRFEIIFLKV